MRADPLRGQVGGGWALEVEAFFGPTEHLQFWTNVFADSDLD